MALGAFVAGILVGQSPILTKRIEEELRGLIVALFAPVFFGLAGLGVPALLDAPLAITIFVVVAFLWFYSRKSAAQGILR